MDTLGLDDSDRSLIAGSCDKKKNISVAEVLLDVHKRKRGPKERHGHFRPGYWDLEQYMGRMDLGELKDIITYVFAVYKFGFPMPVSLVKRLLNVTGDGASRERIYADFIEPFFNDVSQLDFLS